MSEPSFHAQLTVARSKWKTFKPQVREKQMERQEREAREEAAMEESAAGVKHAEEEGDE